MRAPCIHIACISLKSAIAGLRDQFWACMKGLHNRLQATKEACAMTDRSLCKSTCWQTSFIAYHGVLGRPATWRHFQEQRTFRELVLNKGWLGLQPYMMTILEKSICGRTCNLWRMSMKDTFGGCKLRASQRHEQPLRATHRHSCNTILLWS